METTSIRYSKDFANIDYCPVTSFYDRGRQIYHNKGLGAPDVFRMPSNSNQITIQVNEHISKEIEDRLIDTLRLFNKTFDYADIFYVKEYEDGSMSKKL